MKKINNIILILAISLLTNNAFSQENAIKLSVTDLAFGAIHLNGEHVLSDKASVALNVTMLIPREIPTVFYDDEDIDPELLDIRNRLSGFAITPEYRLYTGSNGAPRGFYVAPYVRYSRFAVEFSDKVDGENYAVEGGFSSFGAGAQLGAQWLINDAFVIDFFFLGAGVERYNLFTEYTSDDDTIDFEEVANDLEDELDDASFIGGKFTTEHGDDFVKVKAPFVGLGLRAGLSLGYAF